MSICLERLELARPFSHNLIAASLSWQTVAQSHLQRTSIHLETFYPEGWHGMRQYSITQRAAAVCFTVVNASIRMAHRKSKAASSLEDPRKSSMCTLAVNYALDQVEVIFMLLLPVSKVILKALLKLSSSLLAIIFLTLSLSEII